MREDQYRFEQEWLAPWAAKSYASQGRALDEAECGLRTCWQRDRDRIIHSKAFRRLLHKAQVFVHPGNDHFRTRLTHTLEVSQISRTVSRALLLNEDLTEAIALGHDLGHTPFGHAGERALQQLDPDFCHNEQGVRVVEVIENEGRGLNLTVEVIDGIRHHSGPGMPFTLEGQVVRLCDRIAYLNHDIDDALRSGYLHVDRLPRQVLAALGERHSQRIDTMVRDLVATAASEGRIAMSLPCQAAMDKLRAFMFSEVYLRADKVAEEDALGRRLVALYHYLLAHADELPEEYRRQPLKLAVSDYIAGMTDNFALDLLSSHNL